MIGRGVRLGGWPLEATGQLMFAGEFQFPSRSASAQQFGVS